MRASGLWSRRRWLGAMGCVGLPAALPVRAGAEQPPALLLAREAEEGQDPWGYLVSEKFDGVRAYWDGVRLRFRGGGTVAAPFAFLAGLPAGQALDGELWLGRGRFDELSAIVRRGHADAHAWSRVHYLVFEYPNGEGSFAHRVQRLQALAAAMPQRSWQPIEQTQVAHAAALQQRLEHVVADGGEGLVLHRADALYSTGRSDVLLKLKPAHDAEAVVVGYTRGEGRFEGQTGALRVRDDGGREFLVGSGLTDEQRRDPPPLGSVVTYRWRGETLQGLPRFPTLVRVREAGW